MTQCKIIMQLSGGVEKGLAERLVVFHQMAMTYDAAFGVLPASSLSSVQPRANERGAPSSSERWAQSHEEQAEIAREE